MIGPEEIRKLGSLARIQVDDELANRLSGEIEDILGYVSAVSDAARNIAPASARPSVRNRMRPDGEPHASEEYTQALLALAPESSKGSIVVKGILPS
jgi:aspartyl/glutamyl-tRNA(Asn/Gln) amidotransferase C subunit